MISQALVLVIVLATGCGRDRSPSPPSQDEYAEESGRELTEAKRLHAAGQREKAAAILRRLLAAESWQVRVRAIATAGELKERSLLPELHRALKDPALFVRERASRVLQAIGDASSLPPLREALSSEKDPAVRGNVAEALAIVGGANELSALRRVLESDPDEDVRARTATALGEARIGAARSALEKSATSDPAPAVRARAAAALQNLPKS